MIRILALILIALVAVGCDQSETTVVSPPEPTLDVYKVDAGGRALNSGGGIRFEDESVCRKNGTVITCESVSLDVKDSKGLTVATKNAVPGGRSDVPGLVAGKYTVSQKVTAGNAQDSESYTVDVTAN
jgi:hypothetical protein